MIDFIKRTYASLPLIYVKHLAEEGRMELQFLCFNGNEFPLSVASIAGCVFTEIIPATGPSMIAPLAQAELLPLALCSPLSEFVVVLAQTVTTEEKITILGEQEPGSNLYLNLSRVNVYLKATTGDAEPVRLPLPEKIKISTQDPRFLQVGRVTVVRQR